MDQQIRTLFQSIFGLLGIETIDRRVLFLKSSLEGSRGRTGPLVARLTLRLVSSFLIAPGISREVRDARAVVVRLSGRSILAAATDRGVARLRLGEALLVALGRLAPPPAELG